MMSGFWETVKNLFDPMREKPEVETTASEQEPDSIEDVKDTLIEKLMVK